jgi:hypothetical protein
MYTSHPSLLKILLSVGLMAMWTGGCTSTADNLELRLGAAMKIENPAMAEQALCGIARDAADANVVVVGHPNGNPDEDYICRFAVKNIKPEGLHDDTARYCALAYWRHGNVQAATDLAMEVHKTASRDELLKTFAGPTTR